MGRSLVLLALLATNALGARISEEETQLQQDVFQRYWGDGFVWKYDDLPSNGKVPDERVPYSGYIYPDSRGGTVNSLQKYDRAFNNNGRYPATQHERWDTTAYRKPVYQSYRSGLFRRSTRVVMVTPHWHGHCNGWAAAAMRHSEPKQTVIRNGVQFTPADIKSLLAEIYIYNETENLTGYAAQINAGTFHAVIANWIGRASHPVGMEADPGTEKWNYPVYEFKTSSGRISPFQVEVKMNIGYAKDSRGEFQQSPRIQYSKYFHYVLDLNTDGEIVGGQFYRGSSMIDLLWVPLRPKAGGKAGNERGNPHVDVDKVLAIWRDSVPPDVRNKWLVVDPPPEDRLNNVARIAAGALVPTQDLATAISDASVTPATAVAEDGDVVAASAAEPVDPEN